VNSLHCYLAVDVFDIPCEKIRLMEMLCILVYIIDIGFKMTTTGGYAAFVRAQHHQYYIYAVILLSFASINDWFINYNHLTPFYNMFCWLRPVILFFRVASIRRFMGDHTAHIYNRAFSFFLSFFLSSSSLVSNITHKTHIYVYL
jgi:hypothetical protein